MPEKNKHIDNGIPDQGTPIPRSAPVDFDQLFVGGKEVFAGKGESDAKIPKVSQLQAKKDRSAEDTVDELRKRFNDLLQGLLDAGVMEKE